MRKNLLVVLFLGFMLSSATHVFGQLQSQHAVGLRFGSASGITYRYTLAEDRAAEALLSIQSNDAISRFRLGGLYQYHKPLAENFSWFYGFGGSIGSIKYKAQTVQTISNGQTIISRTDAKTELALSVDGIVGVEYNIPSAPLAVSFDIKPYFDFLQKSTIELVDPVGFSIRYKF